MTPDILTIKSDYLCTGRAASALYLIAQAEKLHGKKVLLPCNICYAAVFPFVYSGCTPVFCDTDPKSGNLTLKSLVANSNCSAAVVPHMYGNPVKDIFEIKEFCNSSGILLIEDCASAMGAENNGVPCGAFGDYTIFSTGYSKTIDIGFGGILCSDRDLSTIREIACSLPPKSKQAEIDEAFFGKLYRLIRNNPEQSLSQYVWSGMKDVLKHIFVYNITPEESREIIKSLDRLEEIISQRRKEQELYSQFMRNAGNIESYDFADGAVPWRYCMFTDPHTKRSIIDGLLQLHLPVSDWYPVVTDIFGENVQNYPNAMEFERRILNFPLMAGETLIRQICDSVSKIFK